MSKWLIFIFVPMIIISILDVIKAFIFGGIFHLEVGGFFSCLLGFIVSFIYGAIIYSFAPNKNKLFSSLVYVFILSSFTIYTRYTTSGEEYELLNQIVVSEFHTMLEISKIIGFVLAIFGLHESEKDEEKITNN